MPGELPHKLGQILYLKTGKNMNYRKYATLCPPDDITVLHEIMTDFIIHCYRSCQTGWGLPDLLQYDSVALINAIIKIVKYLYEILFEYLPLHLFHL